MIVEILVFFSSVLFLFHLGNAIRWFLTRQPPKQGCETVQQGFSILIPCYNEECIISDEIDKLTELGYGNFEVILINDGSSDNTFQCLQNKLTLSEQPNQADGDPGCRFFRSTILPNFFVLDKPNSGKGDSLNRAIAYARHALIVTLDADSYLAPGALEKMNRCFSDESVIAAGGTIHILQGGCNHGRSFGRSILINLQMLDYMKGFYIYKLSLSEQNAMAIISGAFGVFRKEFLKRVGGFRTTLGEDIDLTLKLQVLAAKENKRIVYIPQALCYTQCPESLGDLTRQRMRWQKGFVDCVKYFRRSMAGAALSKSLAFHFYIEAFAIGTLSAVFSFSTLLYLILFLTREVSYTASTLSCEYCCGSHTEALHSILHTGSTTQSQSWALHFGQRC